MSGGGGTAGIPPEEMAGILEDAVPEEPPAEALTAELLHAAGATVTGVDVDELGPELTAARIDLTGPRGTRRVTARLGYGLALAAVAGAPVRVADPVMDRLAVPVRPGDPPGTFPGRRPAPPTDDPRSRRHRYEPRNLDFADGLDRWHFGGNYMHEPSGSHWQDYVRTIRDGAAVITAQRNEPYGFAC